MKLPPPLTRITQSRRTSLLVFGVSLGALVASAAWFLNARADLARAYAELGDRQQMLAQARVNQQEAELKVKYADSARHIMDAVAARELAPEGWGERLINLRQGQWPREEVAALVADVARSHGTVFGAESFELSVTRPEESLFQAPPPPANGAPVPLALTLRGTLLFRTTPTSPLDSATPVTAP